MYLYEGMWSLWRRFGIRIDDVRMREVLATEMTTVKNVEPRELLGHRRTLWHQRELVALRYGRR